MAKLDLTLTKDKYATLADPLKEYYTVTQTGDYELDGIGSIHRALETEKRGTADKVAKAVADALKAYEGVDPVAAKEALTAAQAAQDDKLKAAGEFETLRKQLAERHTAELEKTNAEKALIMQNLKREKLANALIERGVIADRVKYLLPVLDHQVELAATDEGFGLKKIGGIGDAAEFDAIVETVKADSAFFFASNGTAGSGASSGNGNGGGTHGAKTMTRTAFEALGSNDAMAFVKAGGVTIDN